MLPPPELVLLIGLQGAGKSSFYRARYAHTHVHVSKDLWPNARRPERRQRRLVAEALAAGRPVVVDNTNPTIADRAPLIAIARAHGAAVIACHFAEGLDECLARNRARAGRARVPDVALLGTARRLQPPTLAEGVDRVLTVRLLPDGDFLVREAGLLPDGDILVRKAGFG